MRILTPTAAALVQRLKDPTPLDPACAEALVRRVELLDVDAGELATLRARLADLDKTLAAVAKERQEVRAWGAFLRGQAREVEADEAYLHRQIIQLSVERLSNFRRATRTAVATKRATKRATKKARLRGRRECAR